MKKHLILISLLFATAFPALFGQTLQVGMRWEYIETPILWMPPLINQRIISVEIVGDTVIQGEAWLQMQSEFFLQLRTSGADPGGGKQRVSLFGR